MRCERIDLKSAYDVNGMWQFTHELPADPAAWCVCFEPSPATP